MPNLPVFYINLASRPDRREFMERQFAALGIAAERIEAVRVDQVPPEVLAAHAHPSHGWPLSPPENACNESHLQAWRRIIDSGVQAGLVLEDDVVLAPGFGAFVDADRIAALGADLVKLETWGEPVWLGGKTETVAPGFVANRLLSSHLGAGAYVISRRLAERAVSDWRARDLIVDQYLFGAQSPYLMAGKIQQISPAPGIQLLRQDLEREDALSESDLAVARRKRLDARPRTLRTRFRRRFIQFGFRLKLAGWLLRDPAGIFSGSRTVPFAGGS